MATKRTGGLVSRSYDSAANLMWEYYVANKAILKSDVREYREFIVQELMQGKKVEDVFSPFVLPIDVVNALLKQAQKLNKAK
jgi:hypothetical protein